MKFFNSVGPNPHVVRMFAAERGVKLDKVEVDLMGGENRRPAYLEKNPAGQLPCLELDDGSYLSEITAICEYLDETAPGPRLLGATPEDRARSRMWTRRVDLGICEPLTNGFRFAEGLKLFESRILVRPDAADGLKAMARNRLEWLDAQMAGRDYIGGNALGLADILLYCFLAFAANVGQPLDPANTNVAAWFERMKARPSAKA